MSHDSLQAQYYYFKRVDRWVKENYKQYDMILCFHIRTAKYVANLPHPLKVIDMIDATSMNYRDAVSHATGAWKLIYAIENRRALAYEVRALREFGFRRGFITSPVDKGYLESYLGPHGTALSVLPMGVSPALLERAPRRKEEENWIVFLGKMSYAPNVDAVQFFAHRVLPLVRKTVDARFMIVGADPTQRVRRLASQDEVVVTGFVEDPYTFIEKAKLVTVPLRFSAGIQCKLLEAMALSKTAVTTSRAAKGVGGEAGKHFVVADNAVDMASSIVDLWAEDDRRDQIGAAARDFVNRTYRWDLIGDKLLAELDVLSRQRG
jgi:glycosyltransferase involved in cell wall biosynthesis